MSDHLFQFAVSKHIELMIEHDLVKAELQNTVTHI
jgi:hypothetical protein